MQNCCFTKCACLPSSYQVIISAFTKTVPGYGTYTCPAQTVTAYKCCVNYDAGDGNGPLDRIVYRPSLINIGTYTEPNCNINFPVYFCIEFGVGFFNLPIEKCVVDFSFAVFIPKHDGLPCTQCVSVPSIITANNACHFVGANEICYDANLNLYTNTFMQESPSSFATAYGIFSYASYFDDCFCATIPSPLPAVDCCSIISLMSEPFTELDYGTDFFFSSNTVCDLTRVQNLNGPGYTMPFTQSPFEIVTIVVS